MYADGLCGCCLQFTGIAAQDFKMTAFEFTNKRKWERLPKAQYESYVWSTIQFAYYDQDVFPGGSGVAMQVRRTPAFQAYDRDRQPSQVSFKQSLGLFPARLTAFLPTHLLCLLTGDAAGHCWDGGHGPSVPG